MNEIAAQELLQHTDFVRRVARALCADEHGAEDLVQETWVTALTRGAPDTWVHRSWLGGVARNLARQGRRGATRRSAREAEAARPEGQPSTDDQVARMETHRRVVSAVLELPEGARQVVVLHYFDGLPPREIAARLGVPVETVRTRVKRARERLRAALVEQHGSRGAYALALTALARPEVPAAATAGLSVLTLGGAAALLVGLVGWPLIAAALDDALEVERPLVVDAERAPIPHATPERVEASTAARSTGERRPMARDAAVASVTDERQGVLTVRDVDGRELGGQSGELYLRPIDGTEQVPQQIAFRDGHFTFAGLTTGTVQIERAVVFADDGRRPVVFENAQFEYAPEEPLLVSGFFLRDSTLRVVDAWTGAQLASVRVLPEHGDPRQLHPGPHFPSSFRVKDEPSPVLLPRARWTRGYWVTAPGYSWTFLKVDHENGGEREVRLEPAGRLEAQLVGHDPGLAIQLRVYQRATSRLAVSCALDEGGFQGFDGLAAGEYEVRAELGALDDPPRVLAEAQVVIPAGGTAKALLETNREVVPPPVAVRGELQLPSGYEELDVSLRIRPADGPVLRRYDAKHLPRGRMGEADTPGLLRWNAENLTPGRYVFVVAPVQYGVVLEVPHAATDDLRIDVPDLYPVVVRVTDARTGEPVERAMMRWTRELPPGAALDAWLNFGLERGSDSATLLAPAGKLFLAASSPTHAQRFLDAQVGVGRNELTLELPPLIPLEVVLTDGDATVPWVPGMSCTFRALGATESHPCGTFGDGKLYAYLEGPGHYELTVGPMDGFRQPDPVVVQVDGRPPAPVVVQLER